MEAMCACLTNPTPFPRAPPPPPLTSSSHPPPFLPFSSPLLLLRPIKPKGFQLFVSTSNGAAYVSKDDDPSPPPPEEGEEEAIRERRVHDKLIETFLVDKPAPAEWRTLLAFSKSWGDVRTGFFKRLKERAAAEPDPTMKLSLLRLSRRLKEVDEDVQRHNELIEVVREARTEIGKVVARRPADFTSEFFQHFFAVAHSYPENSSERNDLLELADECEAVVQAFDNAASSSVVDSEAAKLKFEEILDSRTAVDAYKKIDQLAGRSQLDPAMVMMMRKAWSNAKETDRTKSEVKDIMYHMFLDSVRYTERQIPKEIRIVKYILTVKNPERVIDMLKDAFTPGEEFEGKDVDYLYTTPQKLHASIKGILYAYFIGQPQIVVREARNLLNPKMIRRLEKLMTLIENRFL